MTITPGAASVDACSTSSFTAAVFGTSNAAVTWSVQEGAAGGKIDTNGVYTAPSVSGTYHIVATSQADTTKQQTAAVIVAERVLLVEVSPQQISIPVNGTAQLTATVTTTCGAYTQTQTITSSGTTPVN